MTRNRLFAVRIASVIVGLVLSMLIVVPVAHADVLDDLRGTVSGDRAKYGKNCPPLTYNQTLQDIGFAQGQFIPEPPERVNGLIGAYGGEVKSFIGVGDPMAAARTDAYKKGAGAAVADCYWSDYGVSFVRYEPTETDWVGIVFGRKATVTPPSGPGAPAGAGTGPGTPPVEAQKPDPPVQCPPGGPQKEVPADQKCPPPANAVTVSFVRGSGSWTVNVKNNAGIGGSCTYVATSRISLPGVDRAFDIAPNDTETFSVLAPVGTYDVVTKCTGTYDGQQVEFGNDKQTVP
jgi:hypothetical protein